MLNKILAGAFALAAVCAPLQAAVLYTFNYSATDSYTAASITFSSPDIANSGDNLLYVSAGINGCAPASLLVNSAWNDAFTTPVFGLTSCGDGVGPDVDGLFFQIAEGLPVAPGTYLTSIAGRQAVDADGGGSFYLYTRGSLVISEDGSVPEPGSLALFGIALAGLAIVARKRAKRNGD